MLFWYTAEDVNIPCLPGSESIVFQVEPYCVCIKAKILANNWKIFPHTTVVTKIKPFCELKDVYKGFLGNL